VVPTTRKGAVRVAAVAVRRIPVIAFFAGADDAVPAGEVRPQSDDPVADFGDGRRDRIGARLIDGRTRQRLRRHLRSLS